MRHYLKSLIITAVTFYLVFNFIPVVDIGNDPVNIFLIVGGFWVISQIINPIFSLILLPVNLLTFGLVSLVLNIAFVYALLKLVPGFNIAAYRFPGANIEGVILPAVSFNQAVTPLVIAVVMTLCQKVLHFVFE